MSARANKITLIALIVALGGLMFWVSQPTPPRPSEAGIDHLAACAPAESQVFLTCDLRGHAAASQVAEGVERFRQAAPFGEALGRLEKAAGCSLRDLGRVADAAVFVACFPRDAEKSLVPVQIETAKPFEVLLGVPVSDEAATRAALTESMAKAGGWETVKRKIGTCWVRGQGDLEVVCCVADGFVMWASGEQAMEREVACLRGRSPSLREQPLFRDARSKVENASGWFGFVAIRDSLAGMATRPAMKDAVDADTMRGLGALQYAACGCGPGETMEWQSFLKVDPQADCPLARAILHPPPPTFNGGSFVPAKWGTYAAVNLGYVVPVVLEAVRLAPSARVQLTGLYSMLLLGGGFDVMSSLDLATDGQMVFACNMMDIGHDIVLQAYSKNKRPQIGPDFHEFTAMVALHINDAARATKLIDRLLSKTGIQSSKARSNGSQDVYRLDGLGVEAQWTLAAKPQGALLLCVGRHASEWLDDALAASQDKVGSIASEARLQPLQELAHGTVVATSYTDLTPMMPSLREQMQLAAQNLTLSRSSLTQMLHLLTQQKLLKGGEMVGVEADGIRAHSRGGCGPLMSISGGAMAVGIVVPALLEAHVRPK